MAMTVILAAMVAAGPLTGVWGGPQVRLLLTTTGGTMATGCAELALAAPVIPSAHGHFKITGTQQLYRPGPQRADVPPSTTTAQIEGNIVGTVMTLTVSAQGEAPQTYQLDAGREGKLVRCL